MIIEIPMAQVAASRPRVTRWKTFYLPKYENFKQALKLWLKIKYSKMTPMVGGVCIHKCVYKMPIPKSWSKKKAERMNNTIHIVKPDKDNLDKALKDAMSGIIYNDDCQVWRTVESYKVWSKTPSIVVDISEMDGFEDIKGVSSGK